MRAIVGAHVGIDTDPKILFNDMGLDIIQVMISSPRSYQYPSLDKAKKYIENYKKYCKRPLFVHSPYLVSLVKDPEERQCKFTVNYCKILAILSEITLVPIRFVTHLGTVPPDMGAYLAYNNIMKNLVCIHNALRNTTSNFRVLLENDSGTYERPKINSAQGLYWILRKNVVFQWFSKQWLGLCFDTNHAFGSGFNRKLWPSYIKNSHMVHFNPIPDFMQIGRCQDRHSEFLLRESKEKKLLKKIVLLAAKNKIPLIVENTAGAAVENIKWIRRI
jgi:endonuclease IV